jgi:hypothetical protein
MHKPCTPVYALQDGPFDYRVVAAGGFMWALNWDCDMPILNVASHTLN